MKRILFILLSILSFPIFGQTTTETINSAKLATKRELKIKLPPSYNSNPDRKYPLILVLDSEFLFAPFEGNLAYGNYWDDIPEVILVGINQNKRDERYADSEFDPTNGLPAERGAAFFEFIGSELLPHLEQKYRISPFKVIAGIDATAGFLNAFLYKENPLFTGYISLSAELQLGMEERIPKVLATTKTPVYYYHATSDGDVKKLQKQINALDKNMQGVSNPLVNYQFDQFKSGTHYSIAPKGIPAALYQFFAVYQPISPREYQEKIVTLPADYVKYLTDKYATIENTLGVKMKVRLNDMKAIEAAIEKNQAYYDYEQLAQISGQQYEKTMLYDYHMGMYWEKRGELKRALKFYQDAFVKEEIGNLTKDMMMNKAEDLKALMPKKDKMKGGKAKDKKEEEILDEVPADAPAEEPKTEEKKDE